METSLDDWVSEKIKVLRGPDDVWRERLVEAAVNIGKMIG